MKWFIYGINYYLYDETNEITSVGLGYVKNAAEMVQKIYQYYENIGEIDNIFIEEAGNETLIEFNNFDSFIPRMNIIKQKMLQFADKQKGDFAHEIGIN